MRYSPLPLQKEAAVPERRGISHAPSCTGKVELPSIMSLNHEYTLETIECGSFMRHAKKIRCVLSHELRRHYVVDSMVNKRVSLSVERCRESD